MKKTIIVNMSEALRGFSKKQEIFESSFDNDVRAASVFAHLITTASLIFCNRLMLGGAYQTNEEDKREVLENLRNITRILDCYTVEDNMDDLYAPDPEEPWWNK